MLTTSPMLFGYAGSAGRLTLLDARTGVRSRFTGTRGSEIALAFLEPRTAASAELDGFAGDELEAAYAAGLIVDSEEAERLGVWERAGWSRPAYLMFSQTNLRYVESGDSGAQDRGIAEDPGVEAEASRRSEIQAYQAEEAYPQRSVLADGPAVSLPAPTELTAGLDGLAGRRSVRAFSPRPPRAEQLGDVLHAATAGHRMSAADRAGGDPFRLLNSRYSWAHLFVVVQHVEGLTPGVFEYDWAAHRLITSAPAPSDEDLAACVQGQRWVLGSGFAVFVVADLCGYAWLYRHSRAYVHVLIQLGELGQELLMAATALGLGGWTTPAVHESRSAGLLGLPDSDGVDVLSMVKLGVPLRRRSDTAGRS